MSRHSAPPQPYYYKQQWIGGFVKQILDRRKAMGVGVRATKICDELNHEAASRVAGDVWG